MSKGNFFDKSKYVFYLIRIVSSYICIKYYASILTIKMKRQRMKFLYIT